MTSELIALFHLLTSFLSFLSIIWLVSTNWFSSLCLHTHTPSFQPFMGSVGRNCKANFLCSCLGNIVFFLMRVEQGPAGRYCTWCRSNWACCLVACIVPENGGSLCHCEGQVTTWSGDFSEPFLMHRIIFSINFSWIMKDICFLKTRLSTRKQLQFCALLLSRMRTNWNLARFWRQSR